MLDKQPYRGRFAPSPTGSLHFGSLFTALAGFLQARSQQGQWLLRIDDLDTSRNVKGSADNLLKTLETFGLHWDDSVVYQSQTLDVYHDILDKLTKDNQVYPCTCSRKTVAAVYSGACRDKLAFPDSPYSHRLKTDNSVISFHDELQGLVSTNLAQEHGDFILKRKDHIIAYQFAVVIDDDHQAINHVVRGYDLLALTPRQIYLQQLLGLVTPGYMHVPVIIDGQGYKLSKQTHATAVDLKHPQKVIFELLTLLKQNPPCELQYASLNESLEWAIDHWNPEPLKNCRAICR